MEKPGDAGLAIARVATQEGVWYSLNIEGQKMPVPRYEQGAALVGSYLYVLGGNYGEWHATHPFCTAPEPAPAWAPTVTASSPCPRYIKVISLTPTPLDARSGRALPQRRVGL
jgi:hypothetical protein